MDRLIQYPAQIPLVEDMLNAQRNAMVGIGHLAGAAFGANTVAASGFTCAPGEGLALTLAPGALLAPGVVDASAYGTLAAVSSALVRQFISRDPVTLAVPAAGATYIVSVAPQTVDTDDTVLPFYNAADPSVTYAGEGNSGLAAPTVRRDEAALSIGATVPEGSYPLWQIVVPAGATAVTAEMISVASGAPFYPSLAAVAPRIVAPFNARLAVAMGGYPLNAVVADPETPGTFWVSTADANVSTPGANGASWQSLFNGYATEEWANKAFVKNNAGTQGGVVALDLDGDGTGDLTYQKADGSWAACQAQGNYVKSVPAAGGTNVRIVDVQADSSGNLIASLLGGGTDSYAPSSAGVLPGDGGGGYRVQIGNILIQSFWVESAWDGLVVPFPVAFLPGTIPVVLGTAGTTVTDWTGWFSLGSESSKQTKITNTGITLSIPSQNGANAGLVKQSDPLSVNIQVMGRVG